MKTAAQKNIAVLNHPLIKHNLAVLRDASTNTEAFNMALKRISYALVFEATKFLHTKTVKVKTPIK